MWIKWVNILIISVYATFNKNVFDCFRITDSFSGDGFQIYFTVTYKYCFQFYGKPIIFQSKDRIFKEILQRFQSIRLRYRLAFLFMRFYRTGYA